MNTYEVQAQDTTLCAWNAHSYEYDKERAIQSALLITQDDPRYPICRVIELDENDDEVGVIAVICAGRVFDLRGHV